MLAELRGVPTRPKLRRAGVSDQQVEDFIAGLLDDADLVVPDMRVRVCRDPKDDMVLEAALAGGAEVIVTGDRDLLVPHPWRGVAILTPTDFTTRFGG